MFNLGKLIGSGSFGTVYECNSLAFPLPLAVKTEASDSSHPQLEYEFRVYNELLGCLGVPRAYEYITSKSSNALVMDRCGPSLEDVGKLSPEYVTVIGIQLVQRIRSMHERGFLHRDLKPQNILLGHKDGKHAGSVFLVDFGLSKKFVHEGGDKSTHVAYKDDKSLTGTPRYCSLNTQLGLEQSRRDDIESMMYVLIYLRKRWLPWMGMGGKGISKKKKHALILKKKRSVTVRSLCRGMHPAFASVLNSARSTEFSARPAYEAYEKSLLTALASSSIRSPRPH